MRGTHDPSQSDSSDGMTHVDCRTVSELSITFAFLLGPDLQTLSTASMGEHEKSMSITCIREGHCVQQLVTLALEVRTSMMIANAHVEHVKSLQPAWLMRRNRTEMHY
jgi:hypothetical protein